ncbi:MAG: phenylalanine--tRNA ligase subunit beta [Chitinophagaceae bacterium]
MRISYQWLSDYLPLQLPPQRLSEILTSIGLEVESLEQTEEIRGSLEGLLVGEVLKVEAHPNADKLRLTRVDIGRKDILQIVCGAPNVAQGQKVLVAPVGSTIFPIQRDPITIKLAKIRGIDSQGMICAADEIGWGTDHSGILVLDPQAPTGSPAKTYFNLSADWIFEIGLTPNRMDAMSHLGVARDICAFLSNLEDREYRVRLPDLSAFRVTHHDLPISVRIENPQACPRYCGISMTGVKVSTSPEWLKKKLHSIGVRPINNIVDITNFVLHECGQPLHAFDADAIKGHSLVIKNLPQDTLFTTLDEKKRKLSSEDLMICDEQEGLCLAGVFGGLHSGIVESSTRIFLESAFFHPPTIRQTSFRHNLRTDAASRFEKGVDLSNLLFALRRAALLIQEIAGGVLACEIIDVFPFPREKTRVKISYDYLNQLSGRTYAPHKIKSILVSLGFDLVHETPTGLELTVPFSKPDISIPADIVEEVMRIDGLDNIDIPSRVSFTPSESAVMTQEALKEKTAGFLAANGFHEILTNSITNSQYYDQLEEGNGVKMVNSLSADLDILRPSMLETGLERMAYNLNRKNDDLCFFEFGKTYSGIPGEYQEQDHLVLYLTGNNAPSSWTQPPQTVDIFFLKGIVHHLLLQTGIRELSFQPRPLPHLDFSLEILTGSRSLGVLGKVTSRKLKQFDIRQPVWYADLNWEWISLDSIKEKIIFADIAKFPPVRRDLALILDKKVSFEEVSRTIRSIPTPLLKELDIFDVFEGQQLGPDKKSYGISFLFQDTQKTLTDQEIDQVMNKLIPTLEKNLKAEIRK